MEIYEGDLTAVQEQLRKINARRASHQTHEIQLVLDSQREIENEDGSHNLVYDAHLEGDGPIYDGWAFVAVIEYTDEGNLITRVPQRTLPQLDLSAYAHGSQRCDVCNKRRNRIKTYIMLHTETGEIKVVGKNCMRDFFPVNIVSGAALAQLKDLEDLEERMRGGGYGTGCDPRFHVAEILAHAAACIREHGYVSRTKALAENKLSTAERVLDNIALTHKTQGINHAYARELPIPIIDADIKLSIDTLTWMSAYDSTATGFNDYMHNLHVMSKLKSITSKHVGLLVSAISGYRRTLARETSREHARATSQHMHKVGTRPWIEGLTVERVFDNDTQFGVSYKHIMHDNAGNIYVWQSSTYRLDEGSTYDMLATIKDHSYYDGVAQTVITRAKYTLSDTQQKA